VTEHATTFAPARINLIGEHTDYSGGLVLPVAVDLGVTVTGRGGGDLIRLTSQAYPDAVELALDGSSASPVAGWGRYVAAVARLLHERGRPPVGFDGTIESTVPLGAGLSSSAALDVSVALALCRAASFELPAIELAKLAQQAEQLAVGVPCGLMDPAASLLGRRDHALLLDCASEETRLVPLPHSIAIVVVDSGVRHSLEDSGYADRRAELERATAALSAPPSQLTVDTALAEARSAGVHEVALQRLRHVVSENERVRACVAALEQTGGPDLDVLGALFRAGHASLRDDYDVSTPELDALVDLAYAHGAAAARMTGGGFGGSIVALVDTARADALLESVVSEYRNRSGRDGRGWICTSVDGAAWR
jgi:galactokinase